jgi:hypothetical protein
VEHPDRVRRRLVPEPSQVQIILGSLLGDARLEGRRGRRRMRIAHRLDRCDYVWWKYDRLRAFAACAPAPRGERIGFHTIAHPLFDDLAPLFARRDRTRDRVVRELLAPLGLAVWMTDVGRLELREDLFLPAQRDIALAA